MADIAIDLAEAAVIAALHDDAAEAIDDTAASAPSAIDAGIAAELVGAIVGKLASDAADLAVAEGATAALMRQIASRVVATDELAQQRFESLAAGKAGR